MRYLTFLSLLLIPLTIFSEGFVAGTLVKTPTGYSPIEQLVIGDCITSYDQRGLCTQSIVTGLMQSKVDSLVYLALDNGQEVRVARDQKFYQPLHQQWIEARRMVPGDYVFNPASAYHLRVNAIFIHYGPTTVYDIAVDQYHTFCVTQNDIYVHNFALAIPIVTWTASAGLSWFEGVTLAGLALAALKGLAKDVLIRNARHMDATVHLDNTIVVGDGVTSQQSDIIIMDNQSYNNNALNASDMHAPSTHDNGAQAPGMPTERDGFIPPKRWDGKKVKNPNGSGYGWPDRHGNVWIPSGPKGHGGPHWDVEYPNGDYDNVAPGGYIRGKKNHE